MSKIKNENYLVIQGWMVNDLKLKGNELLIYAIIFGFSQEEGQTFTGSLQYLAGWTNSTKQGVLKCLKSLVEKNLIIKYDRVINGVKFVEYHTTKLNGVLNKVEWGIKQSLINNKEYNIENKSSSNSKENSKTFVPNLYEFIEKNFGRTLSPIEYEKISKWKDDDLTRYAVEVAVLKNKHNIAYVEGILRNYKDNDISTVDEAKELEEKIRKKPSNSSKNLLIPLVYQNNGIWYYKDENGKTMFCTKPYQTGDGSWKFKNAYGEEMKCNVSYVEE